MWENGIQGLSILPNLGFEDQASHRDITYEIDPLGALKKKIADSPRAVKFLGGERCKPGPNLGVTQAVVVAVICRALVAELQWVRMETPPNSLRRT